MWVDGVWDIFFEVVSRLTCIDKGIENSIGVGCQTFAGGANVSSP